MRLACFRCRLDRNQRSICRADTRGPRSGGIQSLRGAAPSPEHPSWKNFTRKAQREWRRHRPRPSGRCDRCAPGFDELERTTAPKWTPRPDLLVRGRRPGRGAVVGKNDMRSTLNESAHAGSPVMELEQRHLEEPVHYRTRNIVRSVDRDHVCTLTFDRPNSSANIFDRATLLELSAHL